MGHDGFKDVPAASSPAGSGALAGPLADEHVVWPELMRIDHADGSLTLHNHEHGTSLDVALESRPWVECVLEGFAQPRTLSAFFRQHEEAETELVTLMIRSGMVVQCSELAFLADGFLRPTATPVGMPCAWSDLPEVVAEGDWAVLGVPVDANALGRAGARHGPDEIRGQVDVGLLAGEGDLVDYDLKRLYPDPALRVLELGDVDPEGGRMDHVGARLAKVLRELWSRGARPLILGGDHSVTHYVLAEACARFERFGVIHFDAHADLLPSRTLSHASALRAALDAEPLQSLVQIGLRSFERVGPYAQAISSPKRQVVTARDVALGRAHAVLEDLPRDLPYYLTFDVDCLDAGVASETGTPSLGGLSFAQASELVDLVARTFDLFGADFTEVSAAPTSQSFAALAVAQLLPRCFLGDRPFEPLTSAVYSLPGFRGAFSG